MRDIRRHRALAKIATIRSAECDAARHDLMLAKARERDARAAQHRAQEAMLAAAGAWQDHLAGGGFHPDLASALAGTLIERADNARSAQDDAAAMTGAREAGEARVQLGTARSRQAADALAVSRRAQTRYREERALATLSDRISFDWTRR